MKRSHEAISIDYEEQLVPTGQPLRVYAPAPSCVEILSVTPMADDLLFRYIIKWEDGGEAWDGEERRVADRREHAREN